MKITSVDVIMINPETIPMSRPVLCRINTDEGIFGYGEGGATFIIGSDAVFAMLKEMSKLIIGMNPMYNEVIWEKLYQQCYWTKGNGAIIYSALSAIDIALWDIKGKALNKPVYELLGGKFRDKLRCYASQLQFGFYDRFKPQRSLEEYCEVSKIAISKGYDAVKVDVFQFGEKGNALNVNDAFGNLSRQTLKTVDARLQAIRDSVGSDCDIILEQHCNATLNTAIQIAKVAEKYDIMYMEEPLAPLNPELTKILAQSISIPLTTGERSYTRAGYLPFFHDRSLAMIQPDLGSCGGITEGKKICDMAYSYDIGVQAHVCNSPISIAAGLHLEAAIANFTIHETHIINLFPESVAQGIYDYSPVDGYITIPDLPGLGQELSEETLRNADMVTVK